MNRPAYVVLITLVSFGFYFLLDLTYFSVIRNWINESINQFGVSHILAYAIVGIPIFTGTILLHKPNKFFHSLGLDMSHFLKGLLFSLLCTLPMFIGYAVLFEFNSDFSSNTFLTTVFAAAIFEEIYFRGYLFGQIFRFTNWGFIPAVLIGAILFGFIHLYQGTSFHELSGIFLITFMGGILFAWIYVEWNYNLWIPVFLHLFMNLSWGLFSVADNALGDTYANIFRFITILSIIGLTVAHKKKDFNVNRRTLFMKKRSPTVLPGK